MNAAQRTATATALTFTTTAGALFGAPALGRIATATVGPVYSILWFEVAGVPVVIWCALVGLLAAAIGLTGIALHSRTPEPDEDDDVPDVPDLLADLRTVHGARAVIDLPRQPNRDSRSTP